MSSPFTNHTILQILDKYKDLWALGYASAVENWDLETYMPPASAPRRGEALGRISVIRQRLFLDKNFVELIHKAESIKNLSDEERGVVRVLLHSLKFYEKIPPKFLEEFSQLTSEATVVWREAKEKENFKLFENHLSKIFDMNRQAAEYLGYKDSPYDALLDQFEEGLTSADVERFFNSIRGGLAGLLEQIKASGVYKSNSGKKGLEAATYDKEIIKSVNEKILKLFWPEFGKNFRLDISTHPFTTSFSNSDTRITTWYHQKDFGRSILATVHEFGHALYDLQSSNDLETTPIQGGSSLVIHESQSRFWENFIGRSKPFITYFLRDFQKAIAGSPTADEIYIYFNKVKPGLLRVEADEVTYHFHIMLRYEIEKGIIEAKLKVKDLPEIWNTKMKEYLGVVPKRVSEGVLQDIHWSGGAVGYFPTYSLGTFLGAQWENNMNMEFRMSNIGKIKYWLGENIHKYGSTYTLSELLTKNKMNFDPTVNLNYLKEKYSSIYKF